MSAGTVKIIEAKQKWVDLKRKRASIEDENHMAKVEGPCLSVSASGRVGILEFKKMGDGTHQVIMQRQAPRTRSAAQDNQASRFKAASTAWSELTQGQKDDWNAAAAGANTIGYRLYLSEYMNQGIVPPNQPTIP